MRKRLLIAAVFAAVVFAGWHFSAADSGMSPGKKEAIRLVPVTLGDISEDVTSQGKLEAREYVDVGTQVSGQLKKIHVDIGDDVKAGDLLVEIDPKIYQTRVAADEARLKALSAQLAQESSALLLARRQHERNTKLIKSNAVSRDALEETEASLRVAEAKVQALRAEIEEAQSTLDGDKTNLSYTLIRAPISGTVVDVPMREGQTVNATQSAPTILRIANLDVMTVRAQVAEADVMRLKEGMPVHFTTMGQMDRRWPATVRQILPTPEVISDVVLYNVLIDSRNEGRQLMTGMSTQVFFNIGSAKNVPLVPAEVLGRRAPEADNDKGPAYTVKVTGTGKPEERTIHIGLMNRTQAEVTAGLAAGDQIVMPPLPAEKPKTSGGFNRGPRL